MDIMLDYIRMVSYAIIFLTSLRGIYVRGFNRILFVGDIVMATGGFLALASARFLGNNLSLSADIFITPAVVMWAIIHLVDFVRFNSNGHKFI